MKTSEIILAFLTILTMLFGPREETRIHKTEEPTTVILLKSGEKKTITVEDYVTGVVLGEMPPTFEKEALKAQAVAARSYFYYCLAHHSHPHNGADVCDDPNHCCSYETVETLSARFGKDYAEKAYAVIREAVAETAGEVLVFGGRSRKDAICAAWHSSSYGMTEDSGEIFLVSLPYLQPVQTYEALSPTEVFVSRSQLLSLLGTDALTAEIPSVKVTYHGFLRCDRLSVGRVTLTGAEARSLFGLRSTSFTVRASRAGLTFSVYGFGHGVGLSQYGADAMAENGVGYREILAHYYRGARLLDRSGKIVFSGRLLDSPRRKCYTEIENPIPERK